MQDRFALAPARRGTAQSVWRKNERAGASASPGKVELKYAPPACLQFLPCHTREFKLGGCPAKSPRRTSCDAAFTRRIKDQSLSSGKPSGELWKPLVFSGIFASSVSCTARHLSSLASHPNPPDKCLPPGPPQQLCRSDSASKIPELV